MERIFRAAKEGSTQDAVRLLDAHPTLLEEEGTKDMLLIEAVEHGHLGVVRLLVERGADINICAPGSFGRSVLSSAAAGGHEEVVGFLLTKGVQANAGDGTGTTPLVFACRSGHVGVVRMLVRHMGAHHLLLGNYLGREPPFETMGGQALQERIAT
jgi:ankyrin repeat protein